LDPLGIFDPSKHEILGNLDKISLSPSDWISGTAMPPDALIPTPEVKPIVDEKIQKLDTVAATAPVAGDASSSQVVSPGFSSSNLNPMNWFNGDKKEKDGAMQSIDVFLTYHSDKSGDLLKPGIGITSSVPIRTSRLRSG
jgi:hypothetical protein